MGLYPLKETCSESDRESSLSENLRLIHGRSHDDLLSDAVSYRYCHDHEPEQGKQHSETMGPRFEQSIIAMCTEYYTLHGEDESGIILNKAKSRD